MKGFDKASMVRRNKRIKNLPKYDIGVTPILNSLPAAMGLYGAVSERGSYSGPQGGDMMGALAPKNTAYTVGGASYTEVGNPNYGELVRLARMRDKAEKRNTTLSGVQLGATLGSAAGLPGAILGAAGGFIVGNILGLGSDEEDETRRRIEENKLAITGANTLNESVSATLGILNEYKKNKKIVTANLGATPNGLVTGGETLGHTKMKNGKRVVTDWKTYPETAATPKGVDNIKTYVGDQDVIFGNLQDSDGKQISTKAKEITTNPMLSHSEKSDMLTDLMYRQKAILDFLGYNSMRKRAFSGGKSIDFLSTVPGMYQMFNAIRRKEQVEAEPRVAENPYKVDPAAQMYIDNLFDILPNFGYNRYGSKSRRNSQALYDINSRPFSPGERNAMLNLYYTNLMYGDADLAMLLNEIVNNLYRDASKTGLAYRQADQQLQFRGEQDRIKQSQDINKAYWANKLTEDYNKEKGLNSWVGNLLQQDWVRRLIGQYEQDSPGSSKKSIPSSVIADANEEMSKGFKMPSKEQTVKQLQKPNGILTRDIKSGSGYDDVVNQWERDYALRSVLPSVPRITGEDIVLREPNTPAGAEKRTISGLPKLEGNELEPFWSRRPEYEYYELPDGTYTYHRPSRMPILYRDYEPNAWDMLQKSGKFKHLNETLFNDPTGIDWSNVPLEILKDLPMYKYRNVTGVNWSNPKFKLKRSNK